MAAPADQVHTNTIQFPFGGQSRPAYLALPDGSGPFPAVVVIHEIFGLNENIMEIARRFAGVGYAALAVDLFAGRNRAVCMARFMGQMQFKSLDNPSQAELKAALTYLAARPEVDAARLGAIGFCMGGSFAIAWACTDDRLKSIAPFYGVNPKPFEAVKRMCPVVGSYPGKDFTTSHGRKLDAALDGYAIPHDITVYPDARHSFFNDRGRAYDAAASQDAWERILAFFGERLR